MLSSVFLLLLISTGCHFQTFRRDSNISCYSDDDWAERSYKQLTGISNRPSDNITVIVRELATHVIIFLNNRESNILLDVYLTVYWHDHRFIIPPSEIVCQNRWRLDSTTAERMWKPKLNFHGALEAKWHDLPYRNEFLWADGNGTVTYQQKLRLKIPCKLNFDRFPMDEARCFINFAEMEYDDNKVKLNWTKARDPIRNFFKNRNTEEHKFDKHFHQHHMSSAFSSHYTELLAILVFKRQYSWYVLQAYVPSGLIIFVSWIHCTLRPQNVLPRLQIGSAMLLAVVVLFFNILQNVPRVGYVKALDVWLIGCISALIFSAAETAIVALCMRLSQDSSELIAHNGNRKTEEQSFVLLAEKRATDWAKVARTIDNIFICFFPISFICFVIAYWIYYLYLYDYNWKNKAGTT